MNAKSPDTISVSENAAKSKCFLQGDPYKLFLNVMVPDTLLRYKGLSSSSKLCFGQLARFAGQNGACFPSVATVAAAMGLSSRQVERCLAQLEQLVPQDHNAGHRAAREHLVKPLLIYRAMGRGSARAWGNASGCR